MGAEVKVYNALDIAKYVVSKCIYDNKPISNIQLNRILYCIQEDFLKRNIRAFHENICAWQISPIIPEVYYYFCVYGILPITMSDNNSAKFLNEADKKNIDRIIEQKRKLEPRDWIKEIQRPDSAWNIIYADGKGDRMPIPTAFIAKYSVSDQKAVEIRKVM